MGSLKFGKKKLSAFQQPILHGLFQQSPAMNDGHDKNLFRSKLINQTVAINEALPKCLVSQFWHNTASFWEFHQTLCSGKKLFNDCSGIESGIPCNVTGDGIHILNCLWRPDYLVAIS